MTNREIRQHVEMFREAREPWLRQAAQDSTQAAGHIFSINAKIELLLTMWNWSDEGVEYPVAAPVPVAAPDEEGRGDE